MDPSFQPMWSGEIELSDPRLPARLIDADGAPLRRARLLVRAHGEPLGFLPFETPDGRLDVARAVETGESSFRLAATRAEADRSWAGERSEPVTIVLCTRNRATGATRTLESLRALRHRAIEIIVVDNAPDDDSTRRAVETLSARDSRVRYVREEHAGLSCARNRGLREASNELIAFTDDDVCVDPLWVNGLLRGFDRRDDVACVTGLVASASLLRPAEQYFDRRVWWSSSCAHRLFTAARGEGDPVLHPYTAGIFGTGANFAARVPALRKLGGFDECLGAGSPTRGGEDLDMFVRLVTAGFAISYEPAALVWHEHRVDDQALRRQMHAYGLGLTAYLTKHLMHARSRRELLRRAPGGLRHALTLLGRSHDAVGAAALDQREMTRVELRGMLGGPAAYLRARRGARPEHLRAVAP